MDVAGVRVICSFEEDMFFLAKYLKDQSDIEIIPKCFSASVMALSLSGGHWDCLGVFAPALFCAIGFGFIVVLALNNAVFLLYLSDIKTTGLQASLLQNIILDLPICCQSSFVLHHFFHIHINVDMCHRIFQN